MASKLTGLKEAIRRTEKIVGEISAVKAIRAIKAANYIIRTESATMTPIDTSTLINSQFDTIETKGARITGKIGYSAKYALYVHNASGKLKGKPRAHFGKTREGVEFGGGTLNGKYWDPHAEPKFLLKAAKNAKPLIDKIIKDEMKL